MKEQYETNVDDDNFVEKYPTFEDWQDTEDYYEEISFIKQMEWDDFNDNYQDELEIVGYCRDSYELIRKNNGNRRGVIRNSRKKL